MKKMKWILPIMIAVFSVAFFTQCKKDHDCRMRITCQYSSNGLDADTVVPFALISFDTVKYNAGLFVDTLISRVQGVKTDKDGVFEYTLPYPALIIVNAVKFDTVWDDNHQFVSATKYTGTAQVQVNEGELTEKTILLVENY